MSKMYCLKYLFVFLLAQSITTMPTQEDQDQDDESQMVF